MEIEAKALTTCEVAADGGTITLGFVDSGGAPAMLKLSLDQTGALAMTLPGLIDKALQVQYGDASLRYTYPLDSWTVEQPSDPQRGMVTFRATDGLQRVLFNSKAAAEQTRRSDLRTTGHAVALHN